jgi:hypothetical protein
MSETVSDDKARAAAIRERLLAALIYDAGTWDRFGAAFLAANNGSMDGTEQLLVATLTAAREDVGRHDEMWTRSSAESS